MRTEDGCIIQECLNGKPEAFGMLVEKYKAGIYAFVYGRLGNFQDAQDVTQEVFEEAYRCLRGLKRWESFVFWLYRIARNLCMDWFRIQSRRPDREFIEDQDQAILEISSLASYRENQVNKSLREALDSLPEIYREVILLYYFGGMTIKDIARAIGASPTAIGTRLSRARAQLREEMVAMMDKAFEGQKLQSSFTFRVVEAVKRIKVRPIPRLAGLPWGISAAAGVLITVLSLNPQVNLTNSSGTSAGSPLPLEAKALKTGEIPVEILGISRIPFISSRQGDGDGGNPAGPNAFFMAPRNEPGTWTKKADMPIARWSHSASVVNGKIYAIGGWDGRSYLSTVEEYDPKTDKWAKKLADMPTPRQFLSTSAVNGKIYAIGGYGGGPIERAAVEEYDPAKDKWTKKADMPTPRMFFSTSVVKGKIYAIGGWQKGVVISPSPVEEYDPVADKWTKKPDMPVAVCGLCTGVVKVVDERIYAIGGWDGEDYISSVREYNPATGVWTDLGDMLTPRTYLSASVVDGKIYAIGGTRQGTHFSTVEEYDPVKDKWEKKADMAFARYGLSASVVNGRIYAIGGAWKFPNEALSVVEEYDAGFPGESVEPKGKLPTTWGDVRTALSK